jgi:tRNA modification GTPase
VDEGIVVRIAPDLAQVMPHGGLRVLQRLRNLLVDLGAAPVAVDDLPPLALYPDASDRFEALMLSALARAASPLAIDLLLDQPRRWRAGATLDDADRARSRRLCRLLDPPMVVVAGAPNVGKSTLANALHGRSISIALDEAGTTRDYTVGRIDLGGLVVDWHDTPGLRRPDDAIEADAIDLAAHLLERADLLIALADAAHDWPELPRPPDLRVAARCDMAPRDDGDAQVSAITGTGLEDLVAMVRDRLVRPEEIAHPGPWLFDPRLEDAPEPNAR